MAKEKEKAAEEVKEPQQEEKTEEVNDSEKTFTQKDFDRAVSKVRDTIEAKYKDYDTKSSVIQELQKKVEEFELKEKSELERKDIEVKKLTDQLTDISKAYEEQKKVNLRNEILALPKYANLPRVYKNDVILSDDRDAIIENADTILKEWEQDMGKNKESFSGPLPQAKQERASDGKPKNLVDRVQAQIRSHYDAFKGG